MKANGAPEKIWIDDLDEGFWFNSPSGNKSIEYIRKDAFIEKASEWLRNYINPTAGTYLFDEDIEKFRKAMKGE